MDELSRDLDERGIQSLTAYLTEVLASAEAPSGVSESVANELQSGDSRRVWRIICYLCTHGPRPVSGGGDGD